MRTNSRRSLRLVYIYPDKGTDCIRPAEAQSVALPSYSLVFLLPCTVQGDAAGDKCACFIRGHSAPADDYASDSNYILL
eukprot:IDg10011t1